MGEYKKGDLVRIKSFEWWEDREKDEYGDAIFGDHYLSKELAIKICSKVGEITVVDKYDEDSYLFEPVNKESGEWIHVDCIEKKIEEINIHLKLMKRDL